MKAQVRKNKTQRNRWLEQVIKLKSLQLGFLISSSCLLSSCIFFQPKSSQIDTEKEMSSSCAAGNARFIADQITNPPNNDPITINYKEGLADSFTLNLKTCLKDALRPDTSIQNSAFEILYESNLTKKEERVEAISDSAGCIQWQETYKYKYTLNSSWIGLKRVIRQTGGAYSGGVEIETAVNPWLSPNEKAAGLPQILDRRCEYDNDSIFQSAEGRSQSIEYHTEGLEFLETADQEKPILWAPSFLAQVAEVSGQEKASQEKDRALTEIEIKKLLVKYRNACQERGSSSESCYRRYFQFDFRIPLEFRSLDSIGSFDTKLNGGLYNLESLLLISPKEEDKTYELSTCANKKIKLNENDKSLSFTCKFDIPFFNQNSVFKILHRISAVNSDKPDEPNYLPLRNFEGNYTIEFKFGSLLTNVIIDTNDNNIYNQFLRDPKGKLNLMSQAGNIISAKKAKQADSVNLKVLQLGATGDFKYSNIQSRENTIEREISFVGKICLTDALNSQKLENTKFRVFLQKPRKTACEEDEINQIIAGQITEVFSNPDTKEKFETDNERCLTIPIRVPHKIFNKQRYFEIIAHLLSEDLNLYGSVKLALNPWQRAFQAFQDAQNLDENNIRFAVNDIPPPELVINQFRSINLFPSYGLDKLLNIHIFHRFYLLFQPFIRRPDNVSLGLNHQSRELLRDGYYLVRVLILRNPKETGAWQAVANQDNLNKNRRKTQVEEEIDLSQADYITHTDSVVRSKANFVNFYMPVYLSTKQMYYIASRNMIVIQIYPADPDSIAYNKSDGSIDSKRTNWRAFTGHDLVNRPYGGAINIQNWTNWNLLQPVNIDTDQVIGLSPIGRKYKHFDFSQLNERKDPVESDLEECKTAAKEDSVQEAESPEIGSDDSDSADLIYKESSQECEQALRPFLGSLEEFRLAEERSVRLRGELEAQRRNYLKTLSQGAEQDTLRALEQRRRELTQELAQAEKKAGQTLQKILDQAQHTDKESAEKVKEFCHEDEPDYGQDSYSRPALEIYKKEVESKYTTELLNYFSLENALKPIVLETEQAQELTEDLKKSYKKYLEWEQSWKKPLHSFFSKSINKDGFHIDPSNYPLLEKHKGLFLENRHIPVSISSYPHYIPFFNSYYIRGSEEMFYFRDLISSYLLMLREYSKQSDFSLALFNFIQENKDLLNYNIKEELALPESCLQTESLSCGADRLRLLIHSNFWENLSFASDMPVDSFITKQALIFMALFMLPERALDALFESLDKASNPYSDLDYSWFDSSQSPLYLTKIKDLLKAHEQHIIQRFNFVDYPVTLQHQAKQELDRLTQINHLDSLISKNIDPDQYFNQETLKAIVNEGVKNENINSSKNVSFFKSLCLFWFEDFIKSYLDPKLRISTYTNYVRQFNYLQILEHAYIRNKTNPESFYEDIQLAIEQTERGPMEEEERRCHLEYRQCVSEDFCFAAPMGGYSNGDSKADYCKHISSDNSSCSNWAAEVCSDPDHVNLSLCRPGFAGESCYEEVNYFCRLNPDKSFCADFENRCFKKYTSCLENETSLFERQLDQILNNPNEPVETCVRDFNEFFKVENKMIVYDISSEDNDLKYRGGFVRNFGFAYNNSIGSYMNWTSQRGKTVSVSWDPTKPLPNLLTLGLAGSMSQSQSDNESNSGRIAWDGRAGEAVFLSIGKAEVEVGVKEFQKCLVLKPRPNSFMASFQTGEPEDYENLWSDRVTDLDKIVFSRPGLILCNPVEKRSPGHLEKINESYYYISQANTDPSNSQFLDLYDLFNRPFIAILRGNREFLKFYHMARRISIENPINEQPNNQFFQHKDIAEYARGLSLKLREVTSTGFYPGVYDYPFNINEEIDASPLGNEDTSYLIQKLHPFKIFEVPSTSKGTVPIQR